MRFEQHERWARLALAGIRREYPNKISYCLTADADLLPPRRQTPLFYGCFDWHSAVHGHWTLARLVRAYPDASYARPVKELFAEQFTDANIRTEVSWLERNPSFERPYGLAWLLLLIGELQASSDDELRRHAASLMALDDAARGNLLQGFESLSHPIRVGMHIQTAFSLGLALESARLGGKTKFHARLASLGKRFFPVCRTDLSAEPSGHDFLSPVLAEADLMTRLLSREDFSVWWRASEDLWKLNPVEVVDPEDGHLVHFAGLNLSRAWMLESISQHLSGQETADSLTFMANAHREKGLSQIDDHSYAGSHWLGTFAVYMMHRAEVCKFMS